MYHNLLLSCLRMESLLFVVPRGRRSHKREERYNVKQEKLYESISSPKLIVPISSRPGWKQQPAQQFGQFVRMERVGEARGETIRRNETKWRRTEGMAACKNDNPARDTGTFAFVLHLVTRSTRRRIIYDGGAGSRGWNGDAIALGYSLHAEYGLGTSWLWPRVNRRTRCILLVLVDGLTCTRHGERQVTVRAEIEPWLLLVFAALIW